jgi:large subunit ribosomal protein L35
MPKIKTHKATAKRFKLSGSGKLLRTRGPSSHLRRNKSKRARSAFSDMQVVEHHGTRVHVRRLAPYLSK